MGGKLGGPGGFKPPPSGVPQPANDIYMQHPAGTRGRIPASVATNDAQPVIAPEVVDAIQRAADRADKRADALERKIDRVLMAAVRG